MKIVLQLFAPLFEWQVLYMMYDIDEFDANFFSIDAPNWTKNKTLQNT